MSQAGRTVLINSTLSAYPCYQMHCFAFPKSVLDGIDKMQRDFWWDKNNPKKAYYRKAWSNISKSKVSGGVGIRNPHRLNISLLSKLAWRLVNKPDDLWVRLLNGKYFPRSHHFIKVEINVCLGFGLVLEKELKLLKIAVFGKWEMVGVSK